LLTLLGESGFVFQGVFDACFCGMEAQVAVPILIRLEVGLVAPR
jgi:hypothetical protein